ncbi:hypothetical protein ACFYUM_36490 [Streptomyces fimicarius]|uniref:hypothetical protein n=1 Tax=Streptomyces griseus TaxID=1911 RepID=UPI0036B1F8C6
MNPVQTASVSQLGRLRERMLATAYSNADFWTQRTAFLTDQAVAALGRLDPEVAEALAGSLLTREAPITDTEILTAASDAGVDTSTWASRRETIRAYSRDADSLPAESGPGVAAERVWASLYHHHPRIAAALAILLRDLPPTWEEDLFTRPAPAPITDRAGSVSCGPEIAPCAPHDPEDCEACIEAGEPCRYHAGFAAGQDYQAALITTALTDPLAAEQLHDRHAAVETAKTCRAVTLPARHTPAPFPVAAS